jgi:glycosyltransferase involved in cell wall biosynthesis
MRILIFHGYLLGGTGSNVYNARLAAALAGQGHEVHVLSQDRHPDEQPFVDAAGDWDSGSLRVRDLGREGRARPSGGRCTVYRPDIGGLLPVYVADRYEGVQARTFASCTDEEIARYVELNVAAVAELVELVELVAADVALANHLVMGPLILARALAGRVPYAVKIHGSALEYTVKPEPERFLPAAREGLAGATGVLVGSRHTAESLWRTIEDAALPARTRLGPPGVDVERFAPREPVAAAAGVRELSARLARLGAQASAGPEDGAFARDVPAAAAALGRLDPEHERLVAFVGKLIVSKGVDLLAAAWPLVLERHPDARLVMVGFGAYRTGLERLIGALAAGDLPAAVAIAAAGRSLEDETAPPSPLRHLLAFLEGLEGAEREHYLAACEGLAEGIVLTGRLEHDELAELLPACEALVVPSTFPEAFGMVAAEAAACGVLPVSAAHSGLQEVSVALAQTLPEAAGACLSFTVDDDAVRSLAGCLLGWMAIDRDVRALARDGLTGTVRRRWSWAGVAEGVIAAAQGRLEGLQEP